MSIFGENLHAWALIATITHDELARVAHDSNLSWIPQLTLLLAWYSKLKLEVSSFVEYLKEQVVIQVLPESEKKRKQKRFWFAARQSSLIIRNNKTKATKILVVLCLVTRKISGQPHRSLSQSKQSVTAWGRVVVAVIRRIHLDAVVVGVRNHYIFIIAQAKAMGRIELALVGPQLPKLAANLHWSGLAGSSAAHLLRKGRHRVVAIADQVQIIWCVETSH